ncbi:hypothetical protein [Demequina litorisediminis]|uniref:Uncharacterized protein n=1 Tax=Demequina litorisediminis TaxID=1849022 RepID=A0ABQ6III3_9MICO|nr:hypothetical protein [Demequina litorisediminis]GMA36961.1 hypothetical protein GCM10025876_31650 [Demequina litorisediminis]
MGTGFTYVQPTTHGQRYLPDNIELDLVGGDLNVTTTAGIQSLGVNSLDNALGVGIDAPSQITSIGTTIEDVPAGTGNYEQAGLYFGIDEDNYVKARGGVDAHPDAHRVPGGAERGARSGPDSVEFAHRGQ